MSFLRASAVLRPTFLSYLVCLTLPAQGTAHYATGQVAPASARYRDGDSATALPFGSSTARHVLFAYDGSTVAYSAPVRIGGIALRCDAGTPGTSSAGNYDFTLKVSTGRNPAGALDPTFANNHGDDLTPVRSGALAVPAPPVGSSFNPFSLKIPFATPFEWDPRNGPLILDFAYNASTPAFGGWDAVTSGIGGLSANGASTAIATSILGVAPVIEIFHLGLVSPASHAVTEGSTYSDFPWGMSYNAPVRCLTVHDPASFGFTVPQLITALAWRRDQGNSNPSRSYDVRITVSHTPVLAASMSGTFSANHGSDPTVLWDGQLGCDGTAADPSPGHFDLVFVLPTPFLYDPSRGGLAVDVQVRSGAGAPRSFDCVSSVPGIGRAYSTVSATATTASAVQPGVGLPIALRSLPVATMPASLLRAPNPSSGNQTSYPFNAATSRSMQLVSAAECGLDRPLFVRYLRFRPGGQTSSGPTTWDLTVDLSHAATTPAAMSSTFDSNHGSNRRRVYDGQVSVPWSTRNATDPDFAIEIKLDESFVWVPSAAPYLAVDLRVTGRSGPGLTIETTFRLTVDDGRIYSTSSANATTGSTQTTAAVLQLFGEHQNGLATNYGSGCSGLNGVPLCTTVGLPHLPNPGFRVRVRQAAGNAAAALVLGLSPASLPLPGAPGCTLLHGLELGSHGVAITDAVGDASLLLALPGEPAFDGIQLRAQWAVLDQNANTLGVATSNAQVLTLRFF